jgi:hypothetical protein
VSPYEAIRDIAREQMEAAARGDLDAAVGLIDERARLLADAPAPGAQDQDAIHETLRLDRELACAIRQRMLDLRAEAVSTQQARTAVAGYRPPRGRKPLMLDAQL